MSFHIASQSVTNPRLGLTINLKQNDADTSKVILEIISSGVTDLDADGKPDGEVRPAHTLQLVFNRGGLLLYQKVTDPDGNDYHQQMGVNEIRDPSGATIAGLGQVNTSQSMANPGNNPFAMGHQPVTDRTRPRPNEGKPSDDPLSGRRDMRVGGRDPSADDPYTYQPPMDPDAKQRGDVNVGNTAPYVPKPTDPAEMPNDAELRREAMEKSKAAAKENIDDKTGLPKPAGDARAYGQADTSAKPVLEPKPEHGKSEPVRSTLPAGTQFSSADAGYEVGSSPAPVYKHADDGQRTLEPTRKPL